MSKQTATRRATLRALCTAAVTTVLSTAGTATPQQDAGDESPEHGAGTEMTGVYSGTVDRIVDGEQVVILVEAGGRVVDQQIVPAKEYPSLAEGDPVSLLILFGSILALWETSDT